MPGTWDNQDPHASSKRHLHWQIQLLYACTLRMQVGSVVFVDVKTYTSLESWTADAEKHRVPEDSPYAFQQKSGPAYGWVVGAAERLPQPLPLPHMRRIMRSIYEVAQGPINA